MTRNRRLAARLILFLIVVAIALIFGLGYRAIVDRWEGDIRETLVSAILAGIIIFVAGILTLQWSERRSKLIGQNGDRDYS